MALYFAPMDAVSNSGRFSFQTFKMSSLISGRTFLEAERKALVSAIEFDLSPRGDDWICRTFIMEDPGFGTSALPPRSKPLLPWDAIRSRNGSRLRLRSCGCGRARSTIARDRD